MASQEALNIVQLGKLLTNRKREDESLLQNDHLMVVSTPLKIKRRRHKVIVGVRKIYEHLHKFLIHNKMKETHTTPTFVKEHGGALLFLAACLPRQIPSFWSRTDFFHNILQLFYERLLVNPKEVLFYGLEFLVASRWMQWKTGEDFVMNELDNISIQDLHDHFVYVMPDRDNKTSTFRELTNKMCLNYLSSHYLKQRDPDNDPQEWTYKVAEYFVARYDELDEDLEFEKDMPLIKEQSIDKLIFVTHVVLIATDYGNVKLRELHRHDDQQSECIRTQLFQLCLKWYNNIKRRNAEHVNMEWFFEVMFAMYLIDPLRKIQCIPNTIITDYNKYLQNAFKSDLHRITTSKYCKENIFYPHYSKDASKLKKKLADFKVVNYHTNLVAAMMLTSGFAYYECKNERLRFADDFVPNPLYELEKNGLTKGSVHDSLKDQLQGVRSHTVDWSKNYSSMKNLVIQLNGTRQENEIITAELVTKDQRDSLGVDLRQWTLPSTFWEELRDHVAQTLKVNRDRVVIFPDLTYLRMKKESAFTNPHSDFFYFVKKTDMLQVLHDRVGYNIDDGKCIICMKEQYPVSAVKFDKVCLCNDCVSKPIHLYTAWISLGDYDNKKNTMMEFLQYSMQADYEVLHLDAQMQAEVPICLPEKKQQKWFYAYPKRMKFGDSILFNCKMVHRAKEMKKIKEPRFSLDVRFGIRKQ